MYTEQPKKTLILNILTILRQHTDEEHRLNQRDIMHLLQEEYGMTVDRKSVKRNLTDLMDLGYGINYTESVRKMPGKNGKTEESIVMSDFYLEREFTDSELRLLIDSLVFSKQIPQNQCRALVEKLAGLSNRYFKTRIRHISTLPNEMPQNKQLFYNIDILDEAIAKGKQVSFCYNRFGTDKKMHPETHTNGEKKVYIVNPYQMVAANGRYYLIGNYDRYDNVAHIRLDRITDIKMTDTPVKPQQNVPELKDGLNLPKHMAEHIYMFSGESKAVSFRTKKSMAGDVLDWFGKDVIFTDETEDEVTVHTTVNLNAMRLWALQYVLYVRVLSPQSLVDEIKEDLQKATERYKESKE